MSNNVALALVFIRQNDNRIQLIVSCKWAFTFGQGFTLAKYLNLLLDRVNRMYIYIFSVLFDTGGFFTSHKCVLN
jgi:hypothetical protein